MSGALACSELIMMKSCIAIMEQSDRASGSIFSSEPARSLAKGNPVLIPEPGHEE